MITKTNPSRCAMIGALAALPVAGVPAIAGVACASPLRGLIEAHRAAFDAFDRAVSRQSEMDVAYDWAFPPEESPFVPSCGGCSMRHGLELSKKIIAESYQHQCNALNSLVSDCSRACRTSPRGTRRQGSRKYGAYRPALCGRRC